MGFQIKDFQSIAISMINWMRATQNKITDFNTGSVARTLVEAPAAELDELYQQMFIGLKEAIPVSVYNSFKFAAITELPTSGMVRVMLVSSTSQRVIAAGSTFYPETTDVTYQSNQDVTIAPESTFADVLVTCTTPGTSGNILSGVNFTVEPAVPGFVSASNLAAFVSGVDTESPEDRKNRFNSFIQSLPRGTVAALQYGLTQAFLTDADGNQVERVISSSIVEPFLLDNTQPIALVKCYIHNGVGSTSGELVNRARTVVYGYRENGVAVPGWKAAGVVVQVFAASETAVPVQGVITVLAGYDKPSLLILAQQAIYIYILSLKIGESVIQAEIIARVMDIEGMFNVVLSAPADDVAANAQTKLMPGAIVLT